MARMPMTSLPTFNPDCETAMKNVLALAFTLISTTTAMACETVTLGDITIENAWSRASIGVSRPGIVYLTIRNGGATDDALTGISTPIAAMPMLHQTVVTDGIATMPHVMSVPVPAGGTLALEPDGFHGMLMGLTTALEEGATFPVTLTFENAGDVTVEVEVLAIGASGPDC
jgi:periplasmic copper chaperone A